MGLNENSQIAIIGAGPSGAHLARKLSESGFSGITLLDPSAPWSKPCAGGLPARTLKQFPFLESSDLESRRIDSITITDPSGERSEFLLPSPQRNCLRFDLNKLMLDRAVDSGVTFIGSKVTGIGKIPDGWEIKHSGGTLKAQFVVGADGVFGITRRKLHKPFSMTSLSTSIDAIIPSGNGSNDGKNIKVSSSDISLIMGMDGYAWKFPLPGRCSIGLCIPTGCIKGREMRELLRQISLETFGVDLEDTKLGGYAIPSPGRKELESWQVCGPGWALTGDASGAVDPMTREGLFYAFLTAEELATSILEGDPGRYQHLWEEKIGRELAVSSLCSGLFYSHRVQGRLLSAIRKSASLKRLFARLMCGDLEYTELKTTLLSNSIPIFAELVRNLLSGGGPEKDR